ncbi:protein FAM32A-like isoform X2 [Centruroides vittatus]|uniref:protein FAM32A-like isoform X2 n=1 Tax=Centruroides vittatus TaxID=120091 RepID=UPI00350FE966
MDNCSIKRKKKKKDKEAKKLLDQISKINTDVETENNKKSPTVPLTKAEKSFLKMKEKKQMERIMEKASKTHKQRVEEFNRHLDSLTEHYDIPKVSWTK